MVEASKHWFEKACATSECHHLIHPWTHRCTDATATMLLSCIKGAYKFYAMVYLIQILMRGKKLGKKEMIEQFKLYLKSGIFGLTVGSSFVTLNCIFRKLFFSQFSYYTTVLLPCTVSGLAVYFEPPHRRVLVVNLFVNLAKVFVIVTLIPLSLFPILMLLFIINPTYLSIYCWILDNYKKDNQDFMAIVSYGSYRWILNYVFEYWAKTLEMKGWLRRSLGRETLIFMCGSAALFYLMRIERENSQRTPLFWFFTPPRVSKEVGEPVKGIEGKSPACPHKGPCLNYILRGTAQLFGVGCAMTMLRTLIPRLLTPAKAVRSLRLSHLKLGLFFGGYIGIYRLIVCLLCRAYGKDSALYALPAGFVAGAAFRAAPSTPIALAPLTSSLQIVGSWCYQRGLVPGGWPLVELLYCVCQGLLFHARVMHEDACPRYIVNLMRTVTSNKADEIQGAFIQKMLRSL